jgi:ABC-type xylose transport system permease subunit
VVLIRIATAVYRVAFTFFLTLIAWIFFRAASIESAAHLLGQLFSPSLASNPAGWLRASGILTPVLYCLIAIAALVAIEWPQRDKKFALEFTSAPRSLRWVSYACIAAATLVLRYTGDSLDFIYFQF